MTARTVSQAFTDKKDAAFDGRIQLNGDAAEVDMKTGFSRLISTKDRVKVDTWLDADEKITVEALTRANVNSEVTNDTTSAAAALEA